MRKQEKPKYYGDGTTCEICGVNIAPENIHSIIVCYAMPGKYVHPVENKIIGITAYQCLNLQHVGCCHAHAVEAALFCLFHHHDLYETEGVYDTEIKKFREYIGTKHGEGDDTYSHRAIHDEKLHKLSGS